MELEFNDQAKIAVTQPNIKTSNFPIAFEMIQEFYWTQLQLIFSANVKINKNNPSHKSFFINIDKCLSTLVTLDTDYNPIPHSRHVCITLVLHAQKLQAVNLSF